MNTLAGLPLTRHAEARLRQRGIPPIAVECLLDWGRAEHDHRGAEILFFDKRARNTCQRRLDGSTFRQVERHFAVYAVRASDGAVVTIGHRRKHLSRP